VHGLNVKGILVSVLNSIYNEKILHYAGNISRIGKLEDYDGEAKLTSRICGSSISVQLKITDDKVVDYAHEIKSCALGQESAAIMAEIIIGKNTDELLSLRDQMHLFLKENGPSPDSDFKAFHCLEPVREYKNRISSTLMPMDAVALAIIKAQ